MSSWWRSASQSPPRRPLSATAHSPPTNVTAFLGLRYAHPPTGVRRFAPALLWTEPPSTDMVGDAATESVGGAVRDAVRDATEYGDRCIPDPSAFSMLPEPLEHNASSEDCLSINVMVPSTPPPTQPPTPPIPVNGTNSGTTKGLPVMVWIYGGGLVAGASSSLWTHAQTLAGRERVIVVSFNYRLGALGFIVDPNHTPAVTPPRTHHAHTTSGPPSPPSPRAGDIIGNGGANGMHDQIVALQWVQRNIAAFGGDPDMVTIFGESSGGSSVCTLVVSPLATKLFKRAIIQSGPCVGRWAPLNMTYGVDVAKRVMAEHGVSSIEGLRDVHPASAIQWPRR